MADRRISDFATIAAGSIASDDLVPIVDVSAGATAGGNKVTTFGGVKSLFATAAQGAKADTAIQPANAADHAHPASAISDSTAAGRAVLTAADAPAQRSALGLGNVDNTSDVNKPVSTATEARVARNEVTRHGAPTLRKLVRTGAGSYALDRELDPMGTDDLLGTLFDRAPFRHGAPIAEDLIRVASGGYHRRQRPLPGVVSWVEDGEVWMASGDQVWRASDGAADGGPTVLAADVRGDTMMVRRLPYVEYSGRPVRSATFRDSNWPFSAGIRRIMAICYHGQSQAVGTNFVVLNGTPLDPGRAAMFATGPHITRFELYPGGQGEAEDYVADGTVFSGLVDLYERVAYSGVAESPMTSLCHNILQHLPSDTGVVAVNVAVGAQPIENLDQGSASWHNLAVALGEIRRRCAERGVAFEVGGLFWSQGGSNAMDSPETYATKFVDGIYDPWSSLMQDHGFNAHSVPVFINSTTHTALNMMSIARSTLILADDPVRNIVAVGPEYIYTSCKDEGVGDGGSTYTTHISSEGTIHRAYFEALAFKSVVIDGGTWQPLRIVSAVRSGATVTLSLNLGSPNIASPVVSNNPFVSATANAGFTWIDNGDGNAVTITGVSINGSSQVVIALSAVPTGTGQKIGYAMPSTASNVYWQGPMDGARGRVADGAAGTLTINGKSYGTRLPLHTDLVNVTV